MTFTKKLVRIGSKILMSIIALGVLGVTALYVRLAIGPINLQPFEPMIVKHVNDWQLGFQIHFKSPSLQWQGWGYPLELKAHDVKIDGLSHQFMALEIPELATTFRLRSLLKLEFIPAKLKLVKPELTIRQAEGAELSDDHLTQSPRNVLAMLLPLVNPDNDSRALKGIEFDQADIIVNNFKGEHLWSLSDINLMLERHKDNLQLAINFKYDQHSQLDFKADFTDDQQYWHGSLKFLNINPAEIFAKIKAMPNLQFLHNVIARLPLLDCGISGKMTAKLADLKNLIDAEVLIEGSSGTLKPSQDADNIYNIKNLIVQGQMVQQKFMIKAFKIDTDHGLLEATGELLFDPNFKQCNTDINLSLENFDTSHLSMYWSDQLVPEARNWIVNNVQRGLIPKATLACRSLFTFNQPDVKFNELNSTITLKDATVRYMDDMPPMTDVQATIDIDLKKVVIAVHSGQILNDVKIRQAVVSVTGLEAPDQYIHIHDARLDGSVECVVELLNAKPFKLLQKYNINSDNTRGHIQTNFDISLPLSTTPTTVPLKFNAISVIRDLTVNTVFNDIPLALNQGQAQITLDNQQLQIDANARIHDDPVRLSWHKYLIPHKPVNSHMVVEAQLSNAGIGQINKEWAQAFAGQIGINVQHDVKNDLSGTINLTADLNQAALKFAGWKKPLRQACTVLANLKLKNDTLQKLDSLQVRSGAGLDIKASGDFDRTGKFLKSLVVPTFKLGATHVSARFNQIKDNTYQVHIDGSKIDVKPHMDFLTVPSKDQSKSKLDLDLIVDVAEISIDDNKKFYKNDIKVNYANDQLNVLSYRGLIRNQSTEQLQINLFPHDNGRRLVLKCANAGELFRAFNIFENFHGGQLKLGANHDDTRGKKSPWDGKLVIENFKLGQVPFLGRLFSLAAPTSFSDLFSDGNKMTFDILKIKFKFNSDKLVVNSGRAHGPSMGITVNGYIDHGLHNLNLQGSILPAYFINTLIAKIPFLGQLISGGKYEGIFGVSYKVSGTRDKPDVSVNPLSVLTPGLLRQVFSPVNDNIDFDDDVDIDVDVDHTRTP